MRTAVKVLQYHCPVTYLTKNANGIHCDVLYTHHQGVLYVRKESKAFPAPICIKLGNVHQNCYDVLY